MEANLGYFFFFKSPEIRFERKSRTPTVPMRCKPAPGIDADFARLFVSAALQVLFMVSNSAAHLRRKLRASALARSGF